MSPGAMKNLELERKLQAQAQELEVLRPSFKRCSDAWRRWRGKGRSEPTEVGDPAGKRTPR